MLYVINIVLFFVLILFIRCFFDICNIDNKFTKFLEYILKTIIVIFGLSIVFYCISMLIILNS